MILSLDQSAIIAFAEYIPERSEVAKQGPSWLNVLNQPPQLGQIVLNWSSGQEKNRRFSQEAADSICHPGFGGIGQIVAELIETTVDVRKDLVRFINDAKIEWFTVTQYIGATLAACTLATD